MIETTDRSPSLPIYKRTGAASYWFELEELASGKRRILQIRRTDGTTTSVRQLIEPYDALLYADPGTNTIRLTDAMVSQLRALPATATAQEQGAIVGNPDNQVPYSNPWNSELEALLLTALDNKVVIGKAAEPVRQGLYYDLKAADLLSEFDIGGVARFLAGLGVVENAITLSDNRTVELTSLVLPEDQPIASQLNILTLDPLFNLIESLAFYGLMPYLWIYGILDFKTFCDKIQLYWPTASEREEFVFGELMNAIKVKQATALTEVQVDQLMKNTV